MPYFFVFISGACALIYEIIWMRIFLPAFGISIYSTTTVLCAFMGGLGLGSYLAPRIIKRWRGSLWSLYAALTISIGITAMAVPYLDNIIVHIYTAVSRSGSLSIFVPAVRFLLSFIVMAIPTVFMGISFPAIVEAALRMADDPPAKADKRVGYLYGLNTLGGAFGCLLAGFVLIYKLGLILSTLATASVNIILGAAAFFCFVSGKDKASFSAGRAYREDTGGTVERNAAGGLLVSRKMLIIFYGIIGMAALSYQLIWTRILIFYLQSGTYSFSIILIVFLAGLGIGSFLFSRLVNKASGTGQAGWIFTAGIIQLLLGIIALATLPVYSRLGDIWISLISGFGAETWHSIMLQKMFIAGIIILPPTILMGIMFPLLVKIYKACGSGNSEAVGYLYAANVTGAIFGSFLTGFILFDKIGIQATLLLISSINIALGMAFLLTRAVRRPGRLRWAVSYLVAAYILIAVLMPEKILASNYEKYWGKVLFYKESAADITTVIQDKRKEEILFLAFHDGRGTSSTRAFSNYINRMYAYASMMANPEARDVLVICMGVGNTASAFSAFPVKSLDIVDISAGCFEAAEYFYTNRGVLKDPRVTTYAEDGRNYLLRSKKAYDIIQLEPPSIHTDGVVNLYTKEFYEVALSKLKPGGILSQWIDVYQNGEEISNMMTKTMLEVFPNSTLWYRWSENCWLLMGKKDEANTWIDHNKTRRLFSGKTIIDDMKLVDTSYEDILSNLAATKDGLNDMTRGARIITDDRTIVDFYVSHLRRNPAFGGGMAYAWSPLKYTFRASWMRDGLWMPPENAVKTYSSAEEEFMDRPLLEITDELPKDVLDQVRPFRNRKYRLMHHIRLEEAQKGLMERSLKLLAGEDNDVL